MSKSGVRRFESKSIPLASHRFTPHFDQSTSPVASFYHASENDLLPAKIVQYMKDNHRRFSAIVIDGVIHDSYVNFIYIYVYRQQMDKLGSPSPEIEAEYKPRIEEAKKKLTVNLNNLSPTQKAEFILRHLKLDVSRDKFSQIYHYTLQVMYQDEIRKLNTGSGVNERVVSAVREAYVACHSTMRPKL
ncbi:MAG: hypothetical protein JSR17_12435 [Proteobacteria bacterium]|nr:hypothetical protein [Pseudomonadota bacterium]